MRTSDAKSTGLRLINPVTGRPCGQPIKTTPAKKDTAQGEKPMPRFFYSEDTYHGNAVAKVAIPCGNGYMSSKQMHTAYHYRTPANAGALLNLTVKHVRQHGVDANGIDRLLTGKRTFLKDTSLRLDQLADLGWSVEPLPAKYKKVSDTDELLWQMQLAGCAIDAGNFFGDQSVIETEGLAFKGLLDGLEDNGIKAFVYFDYSTPGWLKKAGLHDAYGYAMSRMDVTEYGKSAVIAPNGISGDDILLGWADRNGNHVLSRDSFDEFDMRYEWVFRGAEDGYPRLHKFEIRDGYVVIKDIDLWLPIPASF